MALQLFHVFARSSCGKDSELCAWLDLECTALSCVQAASEAVVDGLLSVLVTLGIVPIIRCPKVRAYVAGCCGTGLLTEIVY